MVNTVTITDVTGGDIVAHVFEQARKAAAFDALVQELTESARHIAKRSLTYAQESDNVRGDHGLDIARREFTSGKSCAYAVAADEIMFLIGRHA